MAIVPFSIFDSSSFADYMDLPSLPPHRHLRLNFLTEYLRSSIAFDHVTIGGLKLEGYEFGKARSIDTEMPPLMLEQYLGRELHKSDPLVCRGLSGGVAADAEVFDTDGVSNDVLALLRQFEVYNRTLIPIGEPDSVYGCVIFTRAEPFTREEQQFLSFVATPLHTAFTKPILDRYASQYMELTPGELLCLQLASHGLTSEEIAAESRYEIRTIDSYIRSATKKLKASNRIEAVAEAIRHGLIH